ncbi:MAG: sulfatase [Vicinamibacterales bacterium]|nr:sulfatase [Vicinamibacterales bacterium]
MASCSNDPGGRTDGRRTGVASLAVATAISSALAFGACGAPEMRVEPERIVLVTIDTLRADHLPFFGYPIDTAPFLTSLADRSINFTKAFSHSATTGPSHSSLFTSLYPLQHRVQNNGQRLDDGFVTLSEALADRGFETAAFVSGGALFGDSNIAQGFATYETPRMTTRNDNGNLIRYQSANRTTDAAIRWLQTGAADGKFFLWVHYFDPHNPLRPPQQHLDQVTPAPGEATTRHRAFLTDEQEIVAARPRFELIERYDAEIRFMDEHLGRLYEAFAPLGLDSNTLWVITADHGQGLGTHKWWGHHRYIYNEQIRVPLIFHFSDADALGVEPRTVDDALAEHVDVPVTIMDLLGGTLDGQRGQVQGRSLTPLIFAGAEADVDRRAYAFSERRRIFQDFSDDHPEAGERYALQDFQHKYLWSSLGADELYDIAADPYETRNLIDVAPQARVRMKQTIERIVAALDSNEEAEIVDEATLEQLRSLGYVR